MIEPTPEQTRFLMAQQLMPAAPPLGWRGAAKPTATRARVSKASTRRTRCKTERHKDRRHELLEQVQVLETRLERLQRHARAPRAVDKQIRVDLKTVTAVLDEQVHTMRRSIEQLHSMVRHAIQCPAVDPMDTYIRLPCDQAQRREILRGMQFVKLRRAAEIGIERFRHLDATQSYLSEERFTTEDGVYHCNRWEMNAFPQFTSAQQLYEQLLSWHYNNDVNVMEGVTQFTLREDNYDEIEPTIWNHRMVSVEADVDCTEELNIVGFAHFYEHHELLEGAPLGVIICESVDEDDLYPYKPLERTRKAVQNYHLVCEVEDPATQRKTVVLKSCTLNAQLPAQFPLDAKVVETLHRNMPRWLVLLNQFLSKYTPSAGLG